MNHSAQAIVVDRDKNVYLEDNRVISSLSFIGWACKEGESYIDTISREVHEELGLIISWEYFTDWELQEVSKFWNSRMQRDLEWLSMYYILILENLQITLLKPNITLVKSTMQELLDMDEVTFPSGEKERFLWHVQRALDCL